MPGRVALKRQTIVILMQSRHEEKGENYDDLDEVYGPPGAAEKMSAVEVRGDSLGPYFNRWYVFYDEVRNPMTPDLIGHLCVVGLTDGRVLVKQVQRGRAEGLYTLHSATEKPITDVAIEWAARVNSISRGS